VGARQPIGQTSGLSLVIPDGASYASCRRADAGDLATTTDPLGHTTTRTYDEVSRLLMQTDPLGRLTWYTYDLLNRLSTVADPLQGLTSFTYDASRN
jgi:YD repeat-containing protein